MADDVGFRNVAVHNDRAPDLEIVRTIVHERLPDFEASTRHVLLQVVGD